MLQETLFILQRAGLFGTAAGDVFQVRSRLSFACEGFLHAREAVGLLSLRRTVPARQVNQHPAHPCQPSHPPAHLPTHPSPAHHSQVIDVEAGTLQNVITFPPEGAFVVDSSIADAGPQRTEFAFTGATLQLPRGRRLSLPPFGRGWFDTVYADADIRVARDSRGDTLVVAREGPPRQF